MQIRSSQPYLNNLKKREYPSPKPRLVNDEVTVSLKEQVVTGAIIGASLGTIGGEKVGQVAAIAGYGAVGYSLGSSIGFAEVGGVLGAVAGYFAEDKFPVGQTLFGAAGFVSGGILGGFSGVVVAGASRVF